MQKNVIGVVSKTAPTTAKLTRNIRHMIRKVPA